MDPFFKEGMKLFCISLDRESRTYVHVFISLLAHYVRLYMYFILSVWICGLLEKTLVISFKEIVTNFAQDNTTRCFAYLKDIFCFGCSGVQLGK